VRRRAPRTPGVRGSGSRYAIAKGGPIVVDASVACLWFADEPDPLGAARLLESDSILLSPDFMAVEVTNAWRKKLRRHEMDRADVEQAVTNLLALEITWTPSAELLRPVARLAGDLGHPVYDCLYLALAASRSALLATMDERLRRGAERLGIRIWRRA
jgi:predicted nucleic acid-binding protein